MLDKVTKAKAKKNKKNYEISKHKQTMLAFAVFFHNFKIAV